MKEVQLGSFRRQSLDRLLLRNPKGVDGSGSHHEHWMINQLATQVCSKPAGRLWPGLRNVPETYLNHGQHAVVLTRP